MKELLARLAIPDFDSDAYIEQVRGNASELPNIGIAVSGGGYRALMNGGGFVAAADSRTVNSTNAGGIGGLLQSATYLAGLSGGGWLVGSMFTNNFSSVQALRDGTPSSNIWKFDNSIIEGPQEPGISILNTASYFADIAGQVNQKRDAGYNISITDYWGRALSYQLINATDGGPAYTFSSIAEMDSFMNGDTPMPMLVADGRNPGEILISLNTTVYEFNPFEMGSWDPTTYAFAPLRYLGSHFENGVIPSQYPCVRGFDNSGYIMGTSSSLFNQFLIQLLGANTNSSIINNYVIPLLSSIGRENNDIAQYQPNPFYHYNNATNLGYDNKDLSLVDGGEDLQNIPLNPLIQPFRHVDVIFAVDSSADTEFFWPNGTALVATYERSLNQTINNRTAFPAVPDQNTFVNLGLNTRPTFFGCDPSNMTGTALAPLVVYIPNAPYVAFSNVSTFDPAYNDTERNAIIRNGYDVATMGNFSLDAEWGVCVGCAVLSRSFYKTNTSVPRKCESCFERYCWDGTRNSSRPENYDPNFKVGELSLEENRAGRVGGQGFWKWLGVAIGVAGGLALF